MQGGVEELTGATLGDDNGKNTSLQKNPLETKESPEEKRITCATS